VHRITEHLVTTVTNQNHSCISGFRHDADEICALLGYYASLSGSSVPTFRDNLSGPIFKGQEVQEEGFLLGLSDDPKNAVVYETCFMNSDVTCRSLRELHRASCGI
jgi:hypothetical protein